MEFLALTNGAVTTGTERIRAIPATLLLAGPLVHGIYPSLRAAEEAAGAPVVAIDIAGMTALPGLIDTHVHLFFRGGNDMISNATENLETARMNVDAHLEAGVTTVRDLGADVRNILCLRDAVENDARPGSRIMAAGPILTVPGGHGEFVGLIVRNRAELVAAVERLASLGVDCVKIAVSGGVSTPGSDPNGLQFSEPDIRATVQAARRCGLVVAAHASNPDAVRISAAAGVDTVEHAIRVDDAALRSLQQSNTKVVPTLIASNLPAGFFEDERIPAYIRDKGRNIPSAHRESISRVIEAGVPVLGGTDAGTTATPHGLVTKEAAEMVACGLPPERAIAAITTDAAEALGVGHLAGTLSPGKVADVVVVEGDPFTDISRMTEIRMVIKDGVVVSRRTPN